LGGAAAIKRIFGTVAKSVMQTDIGGKFVIGERALSDQPCCDHGGFSRRELGPAGVLGLASAWMAVSAARAVAADSVPAAGASLTAFELKDVRLLDGPFLKAQRLSAAYLLSLDCDRLLHSFRVNAGLPPKAPIYGGWESAPTWTDIHCQGHSLGHYLSGVALMTAATGDKRMRQRVDYIVAELAACQKAGDSGLLCAFPEGPGLVAAFIAGDSKVTGVPWYTLHKVYAGLRDAYQQTGSAQARDVLIRFADWAVVATRSLSDERFETMLEVEHGGMNEIFADLFALTGNPDYRTMATRFSHKATLIPLEASQDHLDGVHANTTIPKIVGFQRVAEVTGAADYHHAAEFFWRTVVQTRSYATGGHGDAEHFYPVVDASRHVFSAKGSETCGIYNMLKLTRMLFMRQPDAAYADFYERALYNGILASQDPASGMVTYFQGARPGYVKLYCTPVDSFWCCTGTGMENHAKYGEAIYFHDDRALWVNLFISSAVAWRQQHATLTQTTSFPQDRATRLRWTLARSTSLALHLRHPAWAPSVEVRVNGKVVAHSDRPGSYVTVDRVWQSGDTIDLSLPLHVAAVPLPSAPDIFALTYGPLVLAGTFGGVGIRAGSDIVVNERKYGEYLSTPVRVPSPGGSDPDAIARAVRPGSEPLTFTMPDAQGKPIALKPYHQVAHEHYATYWKLEDDALARA
jgi:DUF1680 family protein